jgi:hypothetical protein
MDTCISASAFLSSLFLNEVLLLFLTRVRVSDRNHEILANLFAFFAV